MFIFQRFCRPDVWCDASRGQLPLGHLREARAVLHVLRQTPPALGDGLVAAVRPPHVDAREAELGRAAADRRVRRRPEVAQPDDAGGGVRAHRRRHLGRVEEARDRVRNSLNNAQFQHGCETCERNVVATIILKLQEGIGKMPSGPSQRLAESKLSDFIEAVCSPFARPREQLDEFLQICQRNRDQEQVMLLGSGSGSHKNQSIRERRLEAYPAEHVRDSAVPRNPNYRPDLPCFRFLVTGCPYGKIENGVETCRFGVHSKTGQEYKNLLGDTEMMEKFSAFESRVRQEQKSKQKQGKGKDRKPATEAIVASTASNKTAAPTDKISGQKAPAHKGDTRSGKPSVVTGTGTRSGAGSEAVVSEVCPSTAGQPFQLMTYPQLLCAEQDQLTDNEGGVSSVVLSSCLVKQVFC